MNGLDNRGTLQRGIIAARGRPLELPDFGQRWSRGERRDGLRWRRLCRTLCPVAISFVLDKGIKVPTQPIFPMRPTYVPDAMPDSYTESMKERLQIFIFCVRFVAFGSLLIFRLRLGFEGMRSDQAQRVSDS